jgi:hypothetical protein
VTCGASAGGCFGADAVGCSGAVAGGAVALSSAARAAALAIFLASDDGMPAYYSTTTRTASCKYQCTVVFTVPVLLSRTKRSLGAQYIYTMTHYSRAHLHTRPTELPSTAVSRKHIMQLVTSPPHLRPRARPARSDYACVCMFRPRTAATGGTLHRHGAGSSHFRSIS